MGISRKKAQEYADQLLETPSAHIVLTVQRGKSGLAVLHNGRAVTKCHASRVGMWTAAFVAQALGVELPPVGESVRARVSTGTLWRAVGISSLDLRNTGGPCAAATPAGRGGDAKGCGHGHGRGLG